MSDCIKVCPQCGEGHEFNDPQENFYYSRYTYSCLHCGFRKTDLNSDEGFGVIYLSYRKPHYGSMFHEAAHVTSTSDFNKVIEKFDNSFEEGIINRERSYITMAHGSTVVFVRGNYDDAKAQIAKVKATMKRYTVSWNETHTVSGSILACSPEEALALANAGDIDVDETIEYGVPFQCSIVPDEL